MKEIPRKNVKNMRSFWHCVLFFWDVAEKHESDMHEMLIKNVKDLKEVRTSSVWSIIEGKEKDSSSNRKIQIRQKPMIIVSFTVKSPPVPTGRQKRSQFFPFSIIRHGIKFLLDCWTTLRDVLSRAYCLLKCCLCHFQSSVLFCCFLIQS